MTVEQEIGRLLQQHVDEQGDGVLVTGWYLTWEGQSVDGVREDAWDGGGLRPDGQSPAYTLGLLETAMRSAVGRTE